MRDLLVGRHRDELVAPEVERGAAPTVDLGRARERVPLVGLAERRVVARFAQRLLDHVGIERTGPRVALAVIDDHAHADTLDDRGRERLDLAAEHLDVGLA